MKLEEYARQIADACRAEFGSYEGVELERPPEKFGDLSTNVAMKLAGAISQPPWAVAERLAEKLRENTDFFKVSVAGPGFINVKLKDSILYKQALNADQIDKPLEGEVVVAEYSDPNPFKALHAGHLYTSLVGDAVANIVETSGARTVRVNFGGDVGLHVAKSMWAIIEELGGVRPEKLKEVPEGKKLDWISERYVIGNKAYQKEPAAKKAIDALNKQIYEILSSNDKSSPFARIYWTVRAWSYDGFEVLYERLGMKPFDKYYPESATAEPGKQLVQKGLDKKIFKKSEGAVVYEGEKEGLHTRVFLSSEGLPTYEAKDLGLAMIKWQDYEFSRSLIITGDDIKEYMKVILSVVSKFEPLAAERTTHLTHGQIKLSGGRKMSSREGNIVRAEDILEAAEKASKGQEPDVVLGAVRYSFLKNRIGGDIVYDAEESIAHEGNSGPYLQYALVRAKSIIKKLQAKRPEQEDDLALDESERRLARTLSMYPEVFAAASREYSPHHICNYLYELAVGFNSFYENSRVAGDPRENVRAGLVKSYERVLSHGMKVLGMPTPEKM